MELKLTRETLRFERMIGRGEEQVNIEGEATLPGSMRDAVTVLSVQAQTHITGTQAGNGEAAVRGRVCFQALYTQGDLTRVRALETSCNFTHAIALNGVTPRARISASAVVQETEGRAASGRMMLRALLSIAVCAFEEEERTLVTGAEDVQMDNLQTQMQTVPISLSENVGENRTLVREEIDLPAKTGTGDVLSACATATAGEISGGNGRVSVSGTIEARVLHRAKEAGGPLVTTVHELPYELRIDAPVDENAQLQADVEVLDVMADSIENEKGRTLRLEAEVQAKLRLCRQREVTLLSDLYSISGPILQPQAEEIDLHVHERQADVRESTRLQVALPPDAPPIGQMLVAFALPTLAAVSPAGRRLDAEGIMQVTLIYLPMDSDIPYAVHTREPFAMTFPVEAEEGVSAQAYTIETTPGAATSDRAEVRCVLGLHAVQHGTQKVRTISEIQEKPEQKQEKGFALVWPAAGESRWETARRLRVAPESLRPAGKGALLAFKR